MKTLIKNGVLVTHEETFKADVLIENGVIAEIAEHITADCETIDASGLYVMPGGVDVHTHLNLKLGERQVSDGFYDGMVAAAHGGTTTIVDHPEAGPEGCNLHHQPKYYKHMLQDVAVIDYGIHGVFQHVDEDILYDIPVLINNGIPSMKVYTTYANMLKQKEIGKILNKMKTFGGLTAFHAEDNIILETAKKKVASSGELTPSGHPKSRPDTAEAVAIKRIVNISDDAPVYIVHLSTEKGLNVLKHAKEEGKNVLVETCPQYLTLDDSMYDRADGLKYIMAPPLRKEHDIEALWSGLADGTIDVVATDHCSFSYADKVKYGKDDFRNAPGGCPGVETRMSVLFSEGVAKGRIGINRFVELTSTNPSKIMGMYPKKGSLAVGSDADIILWDDGAVRTLRASELHQKCDYTPFEGLEVTGSCVLTMLRGKVIVKNGRFVGDKGDGKFISRKPFDREVL